MEYGLATASQILPFVKQNIGKSGDGGGDDIFILDSIKQAFEHFRNRETVVSQECWFDVCDKTATLPVHISQVQWCDLYETDRETQLFSLYLNKGYTEHYYRTPQEGVFWLDSNQIKFYTDDYDGKLAKVRFTGFIHNSEGEMVVPSYYVKGIAAEASGIYYLGEQNIAMYREWQRIGREEEEKMNARAVTMGEAEADMVIRLQTGLDTRFVPWGNSIGW